MTTSAELNADFAKLEKAVLKCKRDRDELFVTLQSEALFLRRFLEKLIHIPTTDERGHIVNGFAAAQIPDWEMRQRLEDIDAALAAAKADA